MNKAIMFWLALLCLFCGGMALWFGWNYSQRAEARLHSAQGSSKERTADWRKDSFLTEFTLQDRSGRTIQSRDFQGQVRVVNFFYSVCPSICRQENRRVEELVKEFGPKGVKFLSITCDPENDSAAALNEYARQFHAPSDQWYFLTGELTYLRRVGAEMYQVAVDKQTHAPHLIVVDRWGEIRGRHHFEDATEMAKLKRKLSELLAEKAPPADEPAQAAPPQDADDDGLIDPVPAAK